MKVREMIEVLEAYEAGRTVQVKSKSKPESDWVDLTFKDPTFNFFDMDYRVRPRPRIFWITLDGVGNIFSVHKIKPNKQAIKVVEEFSEE